MTAEELMARLHADPEWVAARRRRQDKRDARDRMLKENEAPIVRDLRTAGYDVESAWDLMSLEVPYPKAIPVLLHHMRKYTEYDHRVREGIARALNVREAAPFLSELLSIYRDDPDESLNGPKGAMGRTVEALAGKKYLEQIIELALDEKHGAGRKALVEWLGRWDGEQVQSALQQLAAAESIEVAGAARAALRGEFRKQPKRRRKKRTSISYDLTIAKNLEFSEWTSFAELAAFLNESEGVTTNGERGFMYQPVQYLHMGIDLEVVNEEGDNIEEPGTSYPEINCINLHINGQEESDLEKFCFPLARSIADHLGWTAFDDQTGEPLLFDSSTPWWKIW